MALSLERYDGHINSAAEKTRPCLCLPVYVPSLWDKVNQLVEIPLNHEGNSGSGHRDS